jgi:hypothetical protein
MIVTDSIRNTACSLLERTLQNWFACHNPAAVWGVIASDFQVEPLQPEEVSEVAPFYFHLAKRFLVLNQKHCFDFHRAISLTVEAEQEIYNLKDQAFQDPVVRNILGLHEKVAPVDPTEAAVAQCVKDYNGALPSREFRRKYSSSGSAENQRIFALAEAKLASATKLTAGSAAGDTVQR